MFSYNNYMLRAYEFLGNRIDVILNNPYITGMGYGYKNINGKISNIPTLTFLVEKKLAASQIDSRYRIPKYVNGVFTDVIEDGVQKLCASDTKWQKRPAYAGLSVTNSKNEKIYGTITYVVTKKDKKDLFILSCSHVLSAIFETGEVVTDVIQPAKKFGGVPGEIGNEKSSIGATEDLTKLAWKVDKTKLTPDMALEVDAAIAYVGKNTLNTRNTLLGTYFKVGPNKDPVSILDTREPKIGDEIWAITANTDKRKYGTVRLLNVVQVVSLDDKYLLYKDQIRIDKTNESQEFIFGDSGAFAVENKPSNLGLGMLISASNSSALFTPINKVLNKMNVVLAKPDDIPPVPPKPSFIY